MVARIIFALIVSVHGVIHLLGFIREWRLAELEGMSGETLFSIPAAVSRLLSIFWLLTCIAFLISAAAVLLHQGWWWKLMIASVFLSQILIIIYWPDARYGTIANIAIIAVAGIALSESRFDENVRSEIAMIFSGRSTQQPVKIIPGRLQQMPESVQRWLHHSGAMNRAPIYSLRLQQNGRLRTTKDGRWMPVAAKQYVSIKNPAFVWQARIRAAPLVTIHGRDKYHLGRGNMLIRLMSILTVADARGPETDQGSLLRFLGEMVWYPHFALSTALNWQEIDDTTAQVTMRYGDIAASGIFHFTSEGDVASFEADRYYEQGGAYTLERWHVRITQYGVFEGMRVPARAEVTWKLDQGDFTWYIFEVTEIEYGWTPE